MRTRHIYIHFECDERNSDQQRELNGDIGELRFALETNSVFLSLLEVVLL